MVQVHLVIRVLEVRDSFALVSAKVIVGAAVLPVVKCEHYHEAVARVQ